MEHNKKYSSKRLWHILLDLDMTTQELSKRSGVSISSLARLKQGIPLSYNKMRKMFMLIASSSKMERQVAL